MAEGVGFEPTRACALPVFKTGAINRSTTPPMLESARELCHPLGVEQVRPKASSGFSAPTNQRSFKERRFETAGAILNRPSLGAAPQLDFQLLACFLREHSPSDQVRDQRCQQRGTHDIRKMMGPDVHSRECDQQRDCQQSEADPPGGEGERGKKCSRCRGMPGRKGVIARSKI